MADALSRIYSDEPPDIVRAESEFVSPDDEDKDEEVWDTSHPIYTGAAAIVLPSEAEQNMRRSARLAEAKAAGRVYTEPKRQYVKKTGNVKTLRDTHHKATREQN
ncbi:hypothetical protein AMATHDRAFT_10340 [Amanita thiersii Skay4041]|uniref:Uncharacterized protein n=1 Tax=Amanita thiersii Skay4041 TaxID=703135 RepID=A0A2A9NB54_9AGAR|nr:hypothetical protein AMATHDRAFT_10340 [Amanita thiersii Skay4041]